MSRKAEHQYCVCHYNFSILSYLGGQMFYFRNNVNPSLQYNIMLIMYQKRKWNCCLFSAKISKLIFRRHSSYKFDWMFLWPSCQKW